MAAQDFHLVTEWRLDAPVEQVWQVLIRPEDWPSWWKAVRHVKLLAPGDKEGVGGLCRMTWATALPYSLTFDMRTTRIESRHLIEGEASGELDGLGRWILTPDENGTCVRYDWIVRVSKPWMRGLAPLLRPVFTWNHEVVMGWGLEGIRRRLRL